MQVTAVVTLPSTYPRYSQSSDVPPSYSDVVDSGLLPSDLDIDFFTSPMSTGTRQRPTDGPGGQPCRSQTLPAQGTTSWGRGTGGAEGGDDEMDTAAFGRTSADLPPYERLEFV